MVVRFDERLENKQSAAPYAVNSSILGSPRFARQRFVAPNTSGQPFNNTPHLPKKSGLNSQWSISHELPQITRDAVEFASKFKKSQTSASQISSSTLSPAWMPRRMLSLILGMGKRSSQGWCVTVLCSIVPER